MTNDATAKRYETVLRLRRDGLTFAQIAKTMGISTSRVGQLHASAERHAATLARWSDDPPVAATPIAQLKLSDRTFDCLRKGGIKTYGEMVILLDGHPSELLRLPNVGRIETDEMRALIETTGLAAKGGTARHSDVQILADNAQALEEVKATGSRFGEKEWEQHAKLLGAVTLAWNRNVHQLLRVFIHLTGIETPLADAIFFSPQSDNSQRRLVERVAKAVDLSSGDFKQLKALLKRLEEVSRGRNLATHTIFGLSAYDAATGQWGAKVVPALDPPQDLRLEADFTKQFQKAELDLIKISEDLEKWLLYTPFPDRPWGLPSLPIAAARDNERARLAADFDLQDPFENGTGAL